MPEPEAKPKTSPTEVLIKAMETFGEVEPDAVLIIWTDERGDLCFTHDGHLTNTQALGLLEAVKALVVRRIVGPAG
jgi:hypothetical protein